MRGTTMTSDEMKAVVDDVENGYELERRWLKRDDAEWKPRNPDEINDPLNFTEFEYRRKKIPLVRYAAIISPNVSFTRCNADDLVSVLMMYPNATIHKLVEDTSWSMV